MNITEMDRLYAKERRRESRIEEQEKKKRKEMEDHISKRFL